MYPPTTLLISLTLLLVTTYTTSDQVRFQLPRTTCQLTHYARQIHVGGTITREQAILRFRRSNSNLGPCLIPIEDRRDRSISEMSVLLGEGKKAEGAWKKTLIVTSQGHDTLAGVHYYQIDPIETSESISITINCHYIHLTYPKPSRLSQCDGSKQGMVWEGDLLGGFGSIPDTLAEDLEVKVRVITPSPRVFSHKNSTGFKSESMSGSPGVMFTSYVSSADLVLEPQLGIVHYQQLHPVMSIGNWTRLVEVGHWGNHVAIQDQIELENRGPTLIGSFSRAVHETAIHTPGSTAHILAGLTLELPAGASNPYYMDIIGNVSTSRFRPSSGLKTFRSETKLKGRETKTSKLELVPRYPIAGGWNYSFVIGYNLEADRVLEIEHTTGQYVLKVPLFTRVHDFPLDLATLRVTLPEGSSNVKVFTPFPTVETRVDLTDKTYLDTTGRPTVYIKKLLCTDAHSGDIYISYSRPLFKSFQKPLVMAGWIFALFCLAAGLRRFEWKVGY